METDIYFTRYVYVATGLSGTTAAGTPGLEVIRNPSRGPVAFRVDLASMRHGSSAELSIYAANGRLACRLPVPRAGGTVTWHGLDPKGRPAGSGVYCCRLRSGQNELTRRFILSR